MGRTRLRPARRVWWTALAALAVLAADFASKRAVQQSLELGERHEIIPGWVVLTHIENTGAAYGLLAGQRWLLVISAGIVTLLTPLLLRALPARGRFSWAGPVITGMILGGALGNLSQRAVAGYVTDFIQTPPIELFQVFNLADAALSVAITGLLAISLFGEAKDLAPPPADSSATEPEAGEDGGSVTAAADGPALEEAAAEPVTATGPGDGDLATAPSIAPDGGSAAAPPVDSAPADGEVAETVAIFDRESPPDEPHEGEHANGARPAPSHPNGAETQPGLPGAEPARAAADPLTG